MISEKAASIEKKYEDKLLVFTKAIKDVFRREFMEFKKVTQKRITIISNEVTKLEEQVTIKGLDFQKWMDTEFTLVKIYVHQPTETNIAEDETPTEENHGSKCDVYVQAKTTTTADDLELIWEENKK